MEKIAENLMKIQQTINNCNVKNKPELIAVTKGFNEETVEKALKLDITAFGENRVQECSLKYENLLKQHPHIVLHLIGPLQSNKVKKALQLFNVIHTLDREKIALEVKKNLNKNSKTSKFFIQVNTGFEKQKSGIHPQNLDEFIQWIKNDLFINIVGLMCIPPINEDSAIHFNLLRKIATKNHLNNLSMGMSSDYSEAIKCGSTHIRIGTALFGLR